MNEILIFILSGLVIYLFIKLHQIFSSLIRMAESHAELTEFIQTNHARNIIKFTLTDYLLGVIPYKLAIESINHFKSYVPKKEHQATLDFLNDIHNFKKGTQTNESNKKSD